MPTGRAAPGAHEDRQLTMATNPLDVEAVLAAAGDEHWSGMPSGTVLGHVHLYVADLERAAAFYHAGLGLDKTVWSYPGALFLSAGGYHHHLGVNTWAAGAVPAGSGRGPAAGVGAVGAVGSRRRGGDREHRGGWWNRGALGRWRGGARSVGNGGAGARGRSDSQR